MKRTRRLILISLLALSAILTGCVHVQYVPFVGTRDWPKSTGAFVQTVDGMQIFHLGYPSQPYHAVGELTVTGSPRHCGNAAVRQARALGGNALVEVQRGSVTDSIIAVPGPSVSIVTPPVTTTSAAPTVVRAHRHIEIVYWVISVSGPWR